MNRISSEGLTEYQNTWVGRIVLIFFDHNTVLSREVNLVELEQVSIRLFIGVIGYSDMACLYRFNDVCELYTALCTPNL